MILQQQHQAPQQESEEDAGEETRTGSSVATIFDRVVFGILTGLIALVPVFFIPSFSAPAQFSKGLLIGVGVLLALIFFIVARFQERIVRFSWEPLLLSLGVLPLVYTLSSFFSGSAVPFFGQRLEVDTAGFMLLSFVGAYLSALVVRTRGQVLVMYMAFLGAFTVIAFYYGLRFAFGVDVLSFGVFTNPGSGPFGSLNDLGAFFGFVAILMLVTLSGLQLTILPRVAVLAGLFVAISFLAIINVRFVWLMVGVTALGTFVYGMLNTHLFPKRSVTPEDGQSGWGMFASLAVLGLSYVFVFANVAMTGSIASFFQIGELDIRPSWQSTIAIGRATLDQDGILGSGPGTFARQWGIYRPLEVNESIAWQADFIFGQSVVSTALTTTGIVGALAWLVFFALFLYTGARTLLGKSIVDPLLFYLSLTAFLGAAYLWAYALFGLPNTPMLFFAFVLTGLFVATTRLSERQSRFFTTISVIDRPRTGFVLVLVMTLLVLSSVSGLFTLGGRYAAAWKYQEAVIAFTVLGDIERALSAANSSIALHESDATLRLISEIRQAELTQLAQIDRELNEDERLRIQNAIATSIAAAERAIAVDGRNYANWLRQAQVFAALIPAEGAHERAVAAYERARALRPQSPGLLLAQAQMEASRGATADARTLLEETLRLRRNSVEAIFLLSQVQIAEGKMADAIASVEAATQLAPFNPNLYFQLGLLRFSEEQYGGAANALERAIGLAGEFANARYFLGLSYYYLGRSQDGIAQFEELERGNPDNQEVKNVLSNMRAGRSPLDGSPLQIPPQNPQPNIRELTALPIEEDDPRSPETPPASGQ